MRFEPSILTGQVSKNNQIDWRKIITSVRETSVSQHNGGAKLMDPLKPLNTIVMIWSKVVEEVKR